MGKFSAIRWYRCLESTNDEAGRLFTTLDNLSVVAAERQTAGRGQGNHLWYSRKGRSLTFSMVFKYPVPIPAGEALTITRFTTLGILDYLKDKGIEAGIKWPNDIWVNGRKICGILIENTIVDGQITGSVVGVGLNLSISKWPADIPNPVSLSQIHKGVYLPRTELRHLYMKICRRYHLAGGSDGRMFLQEEFGKYMFRLP